MQPQFHPHRFLSAESLQQLHHRRGQAVRPGGDGEGCHVLRSHCLAEDGLQVRQRPVGVGEALKVGDVFAAFVLLLHPGFGLGQLLWDIPPGGSGKLPGAGAAAEDAAPGTQGPVPVGAGQPAVQGKLVDLAAKALFHGLVKGMVFHQSSGSSSSFPVQKRVKVPLHRSLPRPS